MNRMCHPLAGSLCLTAMLLSSFVSADEVPLLDITMTADFSPDQGQNRGSLFEVYDDQGNVFAGAGFLGAYNTQSRSNRQRLNFFVKPKTIEYVTKRLPRINQHTGVYLSDQPAGLNARSRNASDANFYVLDTKSDTWHVESSISGYDISVAGRLLRVRDHEVTYDERTILSVGSDTRILENYYVGGMLVLRIRDSKESEFSNRLVAIPWTPDRDLAGFDHATNPTQRLRSYREFAYAMGQLQGEVLVATNTGGVYALKENAWRVIVEPGPSSYQVYAMLNYYDRLLLGHYPSGELFEYDGRELRQLDGWPPVMPGVSQKAREAQTLTIYGGDLYVGVWPWAEVWRYDRNASHWQFVHRMFTHPDPTDTTRHPYEQETSAVAKVQNLWGQRVTSMIPYEDSLYISTSSKTGMQVVPDFLKPERWKDYGRVYRLWLSGQLSVEIAWTENPTTLRCQLTVGQMSIWQDGKLLAEQPVDRLMLPGTMPDQITWGYGVYGSLGGDLVSRSSNLD